MQFAADDWSGRFSAVTASRNLLAHHPSVFDGVEGEGGGVEESRLLGLVVPLVESAVSAKRSVLRMNGLRCEAELFRYVCMRSLSDFGVHCQSILRTIRVSLAWLCACQSIAGPEGSDSSTVLRTRPSHGVLVQRVCPFPSFLALCFAKLTRVSAARSGGA